MKKLSKKMSVTEFEANYYYAKDLKEFARSIGIQVGNFRKVELEELIKSFLKTKKIPNTKPTLPRKPGQERDRLTARTRVINYVGDKETKEFLLELIYKKNPSLINKSGQWYWLNNWRRKMQERQESFTYSELADQLKTLMSTEGRLPQIPSARMNNFISDYLAKESVRGFTRSDALSAWYVIRGIEGPKTYAAYKKIRAARKK